MRERVGGLKLGVRSWVKQSDFAQFSSLTGGCNNRARSTRLSNSKIRTSDLGLLTDSIFPGVSISFSLGLNKMATTWLPSVTTPWSVCRWLEAVNAGPTKFVGFGIWEKRQDLRLVIWVKGFRIRHSARLTAI